MYPKIEVKADFQVYVSFREKFQTQAAGGNPPDVFRNAVGFLRKYDKRGILLGLKSQAAAGNLSVEAPPPERQAVLHRGRTRYLPGRSDGVVAGRLQPRQGRPRHRPQGRRTGQAQVLPRGRSRRVGVHLGQLHGPLLGGGRQRVRTRPDAHHRRQGHRVAQFIDSSTRTRPCRPGTPSGPGRSCTTPTAARSRRDTALYGLAAMENPALLGDRMP